MAISSMLKATPILLSKRRQYFDSSFYSIRSSADLRASSKYTIVKEKSFTKSTFAPTSKKKIAVPFNFEPQFVSSSASNENPVLKFVKWLRIPVVLAMLSLLPILMFSRQSALAFSGGVMGGESFPSSSKRRSSTWSHSRYRSSRYRWETYEPSELMCFIIVVLVIVIIWKFILERRTNIIKLQVGLLVNDQSLQDDLNRIARTTDASTSHGWDYMLKETINSLLRHDKYWISGTSSVVEKLDKEDAEKCFKKLSDKERIKFSEESLVNLDSMEKENITNMEANHLNSTYMVVTILVAAKLLLPESYIPTIIHREDVERALHNLQSIREIVNIQGLYVLWTPQKQNEILSFKQLQENYPKLKTFQSVPTQASN